MAKIVRYNGEKETFYPCTEPTGLVRGKKYEVVSEKVFSFQTDYILNGIEGHFNSCWFDEVSVETFMAISHTVPAIGKRLDCNKIEINNGKLNLIKTNTSKVKEISEMGNNIYKVTTKNNIYIVMVG